MKKILIILAMIASSFLLVGCNEKYTTYEKVGYADLEFMLSEGKTFAFVIGSKTCSACQQYQKTMEKVIKEYQIPVYFIDVSELSQEDHAKLYSNYVYQYTPTTVFIKEGKEQTTYDRIVGAASYGDVVKALKKYSIIEGK